MKKFTFNLEALLTIREWEEQKARQNLGGANAAVERLKRDIEHLQQSINSAYSSWSERAEGRFSPVERMAVVSEVSGFEGQIAKAKERLAKAEETRKQAMSALMKASQQKKVVENLKEKRLHEYQADVLKREAMEIEDMFNARRSA